MSVQTEPVATNRCPAANSWRMSLPEGKASGARVPRSHVSPSVDVQMPAPRVSRPAAMKPGPPATMALRSVWQGCPSLRVEQPAKTPDSRRARSQFIPSRDVQTPGSHGVAACIPQVIPTATSVPSWEARSESEASPNSPSPPGARSQVKPSIEVQAPSAHTDDPSTMPEHTEPTATRPGPPGATAMMAPPPSPQTSGS